MSTPEKTTAERIASVESAIGFAYRITGPDVEDETTRQQWHQTLIAESNLAIASALHELADAVRELRED